MRVTFGSSFDTMTDHLQRTATRLAEAQEVVSTGKRVNRPSDDPAAASGAINDRAELAAIDEYARTTDSAKSRLTLVDSVLSDMIDRLASARAAAIAGQGSTKTAEQREAAARSVEAAADAIFADINTNLHGEYIFSGASGRTAPYTRDGSGVISAYQGDATAVSVDVDRTREARVTFSGDDVLRGDDASDVMTVLGDLAAALRAGDTEAVNTHLATVARAFNRAIRVQTEVGSTLEMLDQQRVRLSSARRHSTTRISSQEDANMAEAITEMAQADTAQKAALGVAAQLPRLSLLDYLK